MALAHNEISIGNADVDVIRLDLQAILRRLHGERGMSGQQVNQMALAFGIKMLHHDKRHAAERRFGVEEPTHGLQPAG